MSVFDVIKLRNFDALRGFLYLLVPTLIVALGVDHATEWIGLAVAVLAPALSSANTVDGFRTWFYRVIAAGQAVLLGLNLFTDLQFSVWIPVIVAIIGGAPAIANLKDSKPGL